MRNYQIGIYEKAFPEELSLREMLELSAQAGYDFFEISIDRTEQRISRLWSMTFVEELNSAVKSSEIPVFSVCLSAIGNYSLGHPDPDIRNRGYEIFCQALRFAEMIGARIIQIPAADVPKGEPASGETDRCYRQILHKMMELASSRGILIGLENMETSYMDSVEKCMTLIDDIRNPYFQLYPDVGNITSAAVIGNTDPVEDLLKGKDHCIALHIKETKPGRYGGLFYGDGHVDFQKMIRAGWGMGIRIYELEYWYTGNPAWKEDLIIARNLVINAIEG